MSQELIDLVVDMREEEAVKLAEKLLNEGSDPLGLLDDCRAALGIIGDRFAAGECFVPELILAGEMLRQIGEMVKPRIANSGDGPQKKLGRIVFGTVEGDIHDIAKDIVVFMLDINGFDVMDLGVDVPAAKFVEAVKEFKPQVVGLSGFLTLAYDPMKNTVQALADAGLRDHVKIMIGGGQMDEQVAAYAKADAYGKDAMAAVNLSKGWTGVN
ncbi:MAG TPA: cobalamin-dependent protein [Acidobacteriota bacterium]|nr:cobalamin-dependent protein [Acidobacteriota bacterium]